MHSLEAGIIVAIAAFFFLSFLTFTFKREVNISKEIKAKTEEEMLAYKKGEKSKYSPDVLNNIIDITIEGGNQYVGENEE